MAIAKRGTAKVPAGNPTTGGTVTVDAAVIDGDYLVVELTSRDHLAGTALPTVSGGGAGAWSLLGNTADRKALVFGKFASGSAGQTITVAGAVGSCSFVHQAYSGVDPTTPVQNLAFHTLASGTESVASFAPSSADSMLVLGVYNHTNDNAITAPATANHGAMALTEKLSTGGNDCACALADDLLTGATATGTISWSQATNAAAYASVLTLKPVLAEIRSGSAAGTGGGTVAVASQKVARASVVGTGGGVVSASASRFEPEVHSGSATMTGGGAVTASASRVSGQSVTVTASGSVTVEVSTVRSASVVGTGAGEAQSSHSTVRGAGVFTTGSGALTLSSSSHRRTTIAGTGSGAVETESSTVRGSSVSLAGGGTVTVVGSNESEEEHSGSVSGTGSGSATTAQSTVRRASATATGSGSAQSSASRSAGASVSSTGGGTVTIDVSGGTSYPPALDEHGIIARVPASYIADWFYENRGQAADVALLTGKAADAFALGDVEHAKRLADASELLAARWSFVPEGLVNDRIQEAPRPAFRIQRR